MQTLPPLENKQNAGGSTAPLPTPLGRFALRHLLGEGPQSAVWLAFDPREKREVAIKLPKLDEGMEPNRIAQWLARARNLSRLVHPRIVPVFEADMEGPQPYLVFGHVPGRTLTTLLAERGVLPLEMAIALMLDVLEALAAAHGANVVHRDLKPSNVLVDEEGRAHVMDFALAPPRSGNEGPSATVALQGTPGYLSPEAALGQVTGPATDIFSAGLLMAEMLGGVPLIDGRDAEQALYRVVHEQLVVPADLAPEMDDKLRAIVQRALARDPAERYASALQMLEALDQWTAAPVTGGDGTAEEAEAERADAANSALQNLLRRMRHKSDFPAMSDAVVRIQTLTNSETESIGNITNEILKDVALTNKLLRMVNSAHYARGGGSIRTVSRAVSLVGLNGIRNMALGLVLLEHMQDKAHSGLLKEEFLRCLMAGAISGELCPLAHESEEAFIAAMFQNLGRLLAGYYFPAEARTIRGLVQAARPPAPGAPAAEESASASELGLGFEALGQGVARAWRLPVNIQRCIPKPLGGPPAQPPPEPLERLRWLAFTANEIADLIVRTEPREFQARLEQFAQRYSKALGLKPQDVVVAVRTARTKLVDMASAMQLQVPAGSPAARLLLPPQDPAGTGGASAPAKGGDNLAALELQAIEALADALPEAPAAGSEAQHAQDVAQALTAGIQDIAQVMVDDYKLNDVLRMILETMLRALRFRYIVFCMRDAKTETLTGRFGLGEGVENVVRNFHVPLKATAPDLLAAVCARGVDTMISDSSEPRIAERLPAWFHQHLHAPAFLLLPLQIQGKPFGLIYADMAQKNALRLDERELALLRTLRNQAVMAFKRMN